MQTPKTRSVSSEVPQKLSPRAIRQLSQANKISKERSPNAAGRKSPRSPVPEKKCPRSISELEFQISQLQEDLKKVRDQLILSESCNKQAQQDAEESKEQVLALSAKLKDWQKQLLELSATGECHVIGLQKLSEERDEACQSKLEVSQTPLSAHKTKHQEEQIWNTMQISNACELMEKIKSESSQRECELNRKNAHIEELKANLMDKETELQGIMEQNENLNLMLDESVSSRKECMADFKADMIDKKTTLQSISEENGMLKLEIKTSFSEGGKLDKEVAIEVEAVKAAERDALVKLGILMEEADMSNQKIARVTEQLELVQVANSEMEAELRRLKVQSDQWRKAAEAAAAMLSARNNGKLTDRTMLLDGYKRSNYARDLDDDEFHTKKNGNMLKKIGVLWKNPKK